MTYVAMPAAGFRFTTLEQAREHAGTKSLANKTSWIVLKAVEKFEPVTTITTTTMEDDDAPES